MATQTQAPPGVPQNLWEGATPEGQQAWVNFSQANYGGVVTPENQLYVLPSSTPPVAPVQGASETTPHPQDTTPQTAPLYPLKAPEGIPQNLWEKSTDEGKRAWLISLEPTPVTTQEKAPAGVPQNLWEGATPEGKQAWIEFSQANLGGVITQENQPYIMEDKELWQSLDYQQSELQKDITSFNKHEDMFQKRWEGNIKDGEFVGSESSYNRYLKESNDIQAEFDALSKRSNELQYNQQKVDILSVDEIEEAIKSGTSPELLANTGQDINKIKQAIDIINQPYENFKAAEAVLTSEGFIDGSRQPTINELAKFQRDNPDDETTIKNYYGQDTADTIAEYNNKISKIVTYYDEGVIPTGTGLTQGLSLSSSEISSLGRALTQLGIEPGEVGSFVVLWRTLDEDTKYKAADIMSRDPFSKSAIASMGADIDVATSKNLGLQLVLGGVQPITHVIAKQMTINEARQYLNEEYSKEIDVLDNYINKNGTFDLNRLKTDLSADNNLKDKILSDTGYDDTEKLYQSLGYYNNGVKVTGEEWAVAGAVGALDVLMMGGGSALAGLGTAGRIGSGAIQVGAAAVFVPGSVKTIMSPESTGLEKVIAGATPIMLIASAGWGLKGITKGGGKATLISGTEKTFSPDVPTTIKIGEAISDIKSTVRDIPTRINNGLDRSRIVIEAAVDEVLTGNRTIEALKPVGQSLGELKTNVGVFIKDIPSNIGNTLTSSLDQMRTAYQYVLSKNITGQQAINLLYKSLDDLTNAIDNTISKYEVNIGGSVKYALKSSLDKIKTGVDAVVRELRTGENTIKVANQIKSVGQDIAQHAKDYGVGIKQGAERAIDVSLDSAVSTLNEITEQLISGEKATQLLTDTLGEVKRGVSELGSKIATEYQDILFHTKELTTRTVPKNYEAIVKRINTSLDKFESTLNKLASEEWYDKSIDNLVNNVKGKINQIKWEIRWRKKLKSEYSPNKVDKLLTEVVEGLDTITQKAIEGHKPALDAIENTVKEINQAIKDKDSAKSLSKTIQLNRETAEYNMKWIRREISNTLNEISEAMKQGDINKIKQGSSMLDKISEELGDSYYTNPTRMNIRNYRASLAEYIDAFEKAPEGIKVTSETPIKSYWLEDIKTYVESKRQAFEKAGIKDIPELKPETIKEYLKTLGKKEVSGEPLDIKVEDVEAYLKTYLESLKQQAKGLAVKEQLVAQKTIGELEEYLQNREWVKEFESTKASNIKKSVDNIAENIRESILQLQDKQPEMYKVVGDNILDLYNAVRSKNTELILERAKQLESLADGINDASVADTLRNYARDLQKNTIKVVEKGVPEVPKENFNINDQTVKKTLNDLFGETRELTREDIGKPTPEMPAEEFLIEGAREYKAGEVLIKPKPLEEGTIKSPSISMEEVNLISEISKDNATLAELRSKGGEPLDIQRLSDRINNNVNKLNKLREVINKETGESLTIDEAIDIRLKEMGYSELDILTMAKDDKYNTVVNNIPPSKIPSAFEEVSLEPKPEEGGGGVGVKEKVETKTEVKTEVKPEEKTIIKEDVKPETDKITKTETETPSKETTTTETGEQVFLPDQTQLSDKIYALIWEDGKLHWAWIAPEPLQQGYIEVDTKSGVANVPKEEYGRMTREQIERLYATEIEEKPTPSEFVAPFGEPSRQPQPSPELRPLTESDFAKPEPIFVPTPVPITTPGYETPEPEPVPPPEPTPEPSSFTRTVTPPEVVTKERVVTRVGTIPTITGKDSYEEQVAKIKKGTVIWIQGRPKGSDDRENVGMYRVLPPPYQQEDSFAMREPPPGYKDMGWTGKGMAKQSLQIIGGTPDKDIEDIDLGWVRINIRVGGGKPEIEYVHDTEANVGQRNKTVGMGRGQIPIEAWEEAKARGVKYDDFIATYNGELVGGQKTTEVEDTIPEYEAETIQPKQAIIEQTPELLQVKEVEVKQPEIQESELKEVVETNDEPLTEVVEYEEPQEKSSIAQRMDDIIGLDALLNDEPQNESAEVEVSTVPRDATVVKSYVRRKKPSNGGKNWWESSYYQNPELSRKKVDVSGITEPTYLGRKVLPPDLGSEL